MLRTSAALLVLLGALGCGRINVEDLPPDSGLGAGSDAGAGEAGFDGGRDAGPDAGPPAIVVDTLRSEWSTPNTIRWRWDLTGDGLRFDRMELVVGPTEDAVRARSGEARVIGPAENPELGVFTLPLTSGPDPSDVTTSFDHVPGSVYFAQLVAIDTDGRRDLSNVAMAQTPPDAPDAIPVFADAETSGYSLPSELAYSTESPYGGTHCYAYSRTCAAGMDACYENIRRQGMGVDLSSIDPARFDGAFLEWAAQIDHPTQHSYYSTIRVMLGTAMDTRFFSFEHYTIRAGGYRVYQWPLRELYSAGAPMISADMSRPLYEFGIGGSWASGAPIRWDEVRVRY